jgi:hypothetical protein
MLLAVTLLSGCPGPPWYDVDTYEQVKRELVDQPDIIYPDIGKYEQTGTLAYEVYVTPDEKRERIGYQVRSRENEFKDANTDSAFSYLGIDCRSINYLYSGPELWPPLAVTMRYRSVGMEYSSGDDTESTDAEHLGTPYSGAEKIGAISCAFHLNGYRYSLNVRTVLTRGNLKTTTFEEELGKAHDELFVIIDSILDQGGILP